MPIGRVRRIRTAALAALTVAGEITLAPVAARAECQVSKMLELPVTMAGRRPTVQGRVGTRDVSFILGRLSGETLTRTRLVFPKELRDEVLAHLGKTPLS